MPTVLRHHASIRVPERLSHEDERDTRLNQVARIGMAPQGVERCGQPNSGLPLLLSAINSVIERTSQSPARRESNSPARQPVLSPAAIISRRVGGAAF